MKPLVALIFLLTSFTRTEPKNPAVSSEAAQSRIVGGYPALVGQLPWQVYINATSKCGGTLIGSQWVLTAGSCVRGSTGMTLEIGGVTMNSSEDGKVVVTTANYVFHPYANTSNYNLYVALVYLLSPVAFTEQVRPIRLPDRDEELADGSSVVVSGWGVTGDDSYYMSDLLYYVPLTTISNSECNQTYGDYYITETVVCAVGTTSRSPCRGDGGGPLVLYEGGTPTLHGVFVFLHNDGCELGLPTGYVRVSALRRWIRAVTGI